MRAKGHAAEAIELLDLAVDHLDEDRPVPEVYQELGLAHRDAGDADKAVDLLEKVIRFHGQRGRMDFPADAARPLAELHEKRGNDARAADLYASLARGSDKANHLAYHRSAARVLTRLDLIEEARRMLMRAAALAEGDPAVAAEIESEIEDLDDED
jgi:tetratricopeptide (TPR) repeat protein